MPSAREYVMARIATWSYHAAPGELSGAQVARQDSDMRGRDLSIHIWTENLILSFFSSTCTLPQTPELNHKAALVWFWYIALGGVELLTLKLLPWQPVVFFLVVVFFFNQNSKLSLWPES